MPLSRLPGGWPLRGGGREGIWAVCAADGYVVTETTPWVAGVPFQYTRQALACTPSGTRQSLKRACS